MLNDHQFIQAKKARLSFLYLNARSIKKEGKLDELKAIIKSIQTTVHVVLLTETWLTSENQAVKIQINNYTHYYNYRTNSRGGGVSAYVHNNLAHRQINSVYKDGNNYLWIHLLNYGLDVGVVYNPGDTNFSNFLEEYESQLQHRKRAIVFGDFNIEIYTNKRQKIEIIPKNNI